MPSSTLIAAPPFSPSLHASRSLLCRHSKAGCLPLDVLALPSVFPSRGTYVSGANVCLRLNTPSSFLHSPFFSSLSPLSTEIGTNLSPTDIYVNRYQLSPFDGKFCALYITLKSVITEPQKPADFSDKGQFLGAVVNPLLAYVK